MSIQYITGCNAASEAVRLAKVEVIAAYPITPQTHIVQIISQDVFNGKLPAEFVAVEGEHSAMSAAVGAAMTGARAFTASSSQGLAYMHEVLYYAAGLRTPVVMAIANRSMASPVSIFVDHQDSLPQRETGFLQYYAENCQDILDLILLAYKVGEDVSVLLPVMVCFDGFYLSHVSEPVDVPDAELIDKFLPKEPKYPHLDVKNPKLFNVMAFPEHYEELSRDRFMSMAEAAKVFDEANIEFEKLVGRKHNRIETYMMDDAEFALVGLGSMMGTTRVAVDALRKAGKKVGMVSIKSYRPLPIAELYSVLKKCKGVGVLDRDVAYGTGGIVYQDVSRCLINGSEKIRMKNFILGIGGRDVTIPIIEKCFNILIEDKENAGCDVYWPGENTALWSTWKENR
jgi:pyruvate ferredoxin oxidoreductase alpha subunit